MNHASPLTTTDFRNKIGTEQTISALQRLVRNRGIN